MTLRPIHDVARDLGLVEDDIVPAGRHRVKVSLDALERPPVATTSRYVLVSAITPTQAGEGKTVTTLGLAMGLARRGRRVAATLRQSSIGPTFGGKGGGAGGGAAAASDHSAPVACFTNETGRGVFRWTGSPSI